MNNSNSDHLPGVLLMDWKFKEVCELCEAQERKGVLDELERANWALALLNLDSYEQAASICEQLILAAPETSRNHVILGVCQWYLGNHEGSQKAWDQALGCKRLPLGGGVEIAAMLYYSSLWVDNKKSEKKSLARLKKLWKPGLPWPVPIAGYLLGEIDSGVMLGQVNKDVPNLTERHLCQAYFWIGFHLAQQGKTTEANSALEKSYEVAGSSILEAERYLAKWELSRSQRLI